jgi:hypothetical protein
MKYQLFYVDKQNRIECMLVCSLKQRINWIEDGLKLVSWKYNLISEGEAASLQEIYKKHSILNIDKRKKNQLRTINIGDIVVFDGRVWILSAFGFTIVPEVLWEKSTICKKGIIIK